MFWSDLRSAVRNAARRPAFTLLVATTLALGLGVNSAVFALVDAMLFRPLPYRDPSRVVFVWQTLPQLNFFELEATPFDYDAWHAVRSLSEIAMVNYGSYTLTGGIGEPERVRGARVTASLMPLLGLSPAIGRAFAEAEDSDASAPTAILSEGLWRRRYGADPAIVGRTIEVDSTPRTVVGVMRRGAALPDTFGEDRDLWLPMQMTAVERALEISHNYTILAHLSVGATLAQASAELDTFAARMAADRPSHTSIGARLVPVTERAVRGVRPALIVAAASVGLLMLVAAANASTLLVARAANRRQELAVRAAIGATPFQLLSLSVTESTVFAAIGGVAGLVLAGWTLRGLLALFADSLPRGVTIAIDARTALFTAGLAIASGAIFGAIAAPRRDSPLAESLGGLRSTGSAGASRRRNVLVVAQIALAVVLLSYSGLMIASVMKLSRVGPGFAADHLISSKVTLTGSRYQSAEARVAFVSAILERLESTPGVRGAGLVSVVPFGQMRNAGVIDIEGRPRVPGALSMIIDQRHVSPGYFQTMQIPLVSGRLLTAADDGRSERVTLINRTMAERYFANDSPLNHRVRTTGGFDSGIWFRIVGVVENVRHISLDHDPVPEMYHPIAQTAVPTFTLVARTSGDPAAMAPALGAAVRAIDPNLPMYEVRTMEERIAASFAQTRATMLLLMATALLAAALAGVAIYGSIWYSVVQRTREIGVRLALGASRVSLFRDVVGSALKLAGAGAAAGIAGALASGRLLQAMLFDTRTSDPSTHALVAGGVLLLATLASLVPAIRATRVDPLSALRSD